MCGIVGALSFGDSHFRVTGPYLQVMCDTMVHRGPDGGGLWIAPDQRIGLGHRRLSIIDRSEAANQPMCNEDGSLWVVFNGEIYNHAEIRQELEAIGGHHWRTDHSDTEVILHAFEQWGIDCLEKFRGMFAIALWDVRLRHLWLIRDRIGVKPLYYSIHHGRITFASEIKALLKDPDQSRAINEEALYHYLSFITTPAPLTLFQGICKVPPATWLRLNEQGQVEQTRYWEVWDHTTPLLGHSDEDIAHRLLDELRTSVQLRKVSDVPVGVFLSGGVDSSTNAALFAEGDVRPVQTFTVGYNGEFSSYQNEFAEARRVAEYVGANCHETGLSLDDVLAFLPQMVHLQDEPLGDPVCVPLYYVSRLAREHGVTVCQLGEGADELFWGYGHWKKKLYLQRLNDLIPIPRLAKAGALGAMMVCGLNRSKQYDALRRAAQGLPVFWGGVDAFSDAHKHYLLSPRLRREFSRFSSWEVIRPLRERFERCAWEPSPLHWMSYLDLNHRIPELLLMRVDKMTMGASVEARVPYLDHKFVELVLSIPEAVKTRGGRSKGLLKRAVRGLIPEEVINRRKQGFGIPLHDWMNERLRGVIAAEVDQFCRETDLFDRRRVARFLASHHDERCWYFFNLALWWKHSVVSAQGDVPLHPRHPFGISGDHEHCVRRERLDEGAGQLPSEKASVWACRATDTPTRLPKAA